MVSVVILEGPAGSGKTTASQFLSQQPNFRHCDFRIESGGRERTRSVSANHFSYANVVLRDFDICSQVVSHVAAGTRNVLLFDRGFISPYVYGALRVGADISPVKWWIYLQHFAREMSVVLEAHRLRSEFLVDQEIHSNAIHSVQWIVLLPQLKTLNAMRQSHPEAETRYVFDASTELYYYASAVSNLWDYTHQYQYADVLKAINPKFRFSVGGINYSEPAQIKPGLAKLLDDILG